VPKGHCSGSTSALWARTPGGLAAGVSDRSDGRDSTGRHVAPGVYLWRPNNEATILTRKAIKIDQTNLFSGAGRTSIPPLSLWPARRAATSSCSVVP